MKIRDGRLYREIHKTFEEYCRERWGFTKTYANNLIGATTASENLTTMVVKPISERQLRPLTHLEPEQQKEVWQKAVETAPKGEVTAKHVTSIVHEMTVARSPVTWQEAEEESDALICQLFLLSTAFPYFFYPQ